MYQLQTTAADGRTTTIHSQWPGTIEGILQDKLVQAIHEGRGFKYQPTNDKVVVFDDGATIEVAWVIPNFAEHAP